MINTEVSDDVAEVNDCKFHFDAKEKQELKLFETEKISRNINEFIKTCKSYSNWKRKNVNNIDPCMIISSRLNNIKYEFLDDEMRQYEALITKKFVKFKECSEIKLNYPNLWYISEKSEKKNEDKMTQEFQAKKRKRSTSYYNDEIDIILTKKIRYLSLDRINDIKLSIAIISEWQLHIIKIDIIVTKIDNFEHIDQLQMHVSEEPKLFKIEQRIIQPEKK
ncbi:hypothetical protein RFI_19341 [Reticulomyxa filosa]|uniref:Uncharacterized protein n=1 Tax=Reticulomyxa filosa TaxID=46433 RepID=X6MVF1_RETFI|nr:hypothetical protein RFI_19341 [Reticulomyxa filosa]|eukprot:ETO17963.1 hypothetical protein RFI_19341 [Reticulomyxa filosa]